MMARRRSCLSVLWALSAAQQSRAERGAAAAVSEDDDARFQFRPGAAAAAGDYAKVACRRAYTRGLKLAQDLASEVRELCAEVDSKWHANQVAVDEICDGECPEHVSTADPFFQEFKVSQLAVDGDIYALEAAMAEVMREPPLVRRRLARLSHTAKATLEYEETGDGQDLAEILDTATSTEMREFMQDTKGVRLTQLFERAQREKTPVQDALKREGYVPTGAGRKKKKRRKRKRKAEL